MQNGFSLLEVLITVFLISLGLFGFIETEIKAMQELQLLKRYSDLEQSIVNLDESLQFSGRPSDTISQWRQEELSRYPKVKVEITSPKAQMILISLTWSERNEAYSLKQTLYE